MVNGQSIDTDYLEKKISKAHPNLTVVGFRNDVIYNTPGNRITKVIKNGTGGDIIFFKNGKPVQGFRYNEFLNKYKDFQ